ncbi:MAG: hypothetical protein IJ891_12640, partial [Prevotella sp.]|nr:hypothetical protein [Prevotella sp.]
YGLRGLLSATMLAGVILIGLGAFRLGAVIKFIPYPIIIGFTAGIAATILTPSSQPRMRKKRSQESEE